MAKWMFTAYGTTPVYAEFFRALGWADKLDPMLEAWRPATASGRSSSARRTSCARSSCSARRRR